MLRSLFISCLLTAAACADSSSEPVQIDAAQSPAEPSTLSDVKLLQGDPTNWLAHTVDLVDHDVRGRLSAELYTGRQTGLQHAVHGAAVQHGPEPNPAHGVAGFVACRPVQLAVVNMQ